MSNPTSSVRVWGAHCSRLAAAGCARRLSRSLLVGDRLQLARARVLRTHGRRRACPARMRDFHFGVAICANTVTAQSGGLGDERALATGPRVPPARGEATHLVVFLHGYGADGNDLIGLAPHLQRALPTAAFVSPNAPERCPGAGYQWFALSRIDPHELARGVEAAAPALDAFLDAELARLHLSDGSSCACRLQPGHDDVAACGPARANAAAAIVGFSGLLVAPPADAREKRSRRCFLAARRRRSADPARSPPSKRRPAGRRGLMARWHFSAGVAHGIGPDATGARGAIFLPTRFAGRLSPRELPASCAWPRGMLEKR